MFSQAVTLLECKEMYMIGMFSYTRRFLDVKIFKIGPHKKLGGDGTENLMIVVLKKVNLFKPCC